MAYKFDCLYFSGYKPCQFKRPCEGCDNYRPVHRRILIISLEALGAVIRSTCLLPPLRRQFPNAHITWVTFKNARPLLENNPEINRLITYDVTTLAVLDHLEFDRAYCVDKSLEAGALAERVNAREKFGFGLTADGAIRPLNSEANYQYDVGLNDELKFHINQKPETQQTTESMALGWQRDPYVLKLTVDEKAAVANYRRSIQQQAHGVIGYNTGCSALYSYKKLTVERSIETIAMWRKTFPNWAIALLGGSEDTDRQAAMKAAFAHDPLVVNTPTNEGLRAGILWLDTCDLIFSGCSLGMHIAIGLQKFVIAWFGVSCSQEVDFYDRGIKLQADVGCSPCWRKSCTNEPKCYNMVSVNSIKEATAAGIKRLSENK